MSPGWDGSKNGNFKRWQPNNQEFQLSNTMQWKDQRHKFSTISTHGRTQGWHVLVYSGSETL